MKKILIAILAASMSISFLAACSSGNSDASSKSSESSVSASSSENASSESSSESNVSTSSESKKSESSSSDEASSKSENSKKSDASSDASVIYKDVSIMINDEISSVIKKLGEPDSKETISAETDEESDVKDTYSYTYSNMTIYSYIKNDKEYIKNVIIDGPGEAKTSKGITAGASRADVEKAYGKSDDEVVASYDYGDVSIIITYDNDKVIDIFFGEPV